MEPLGVDDHGGEEGAVLAHAAAQRLGEPRGEVEAVPLHDQVEVAVLALQQEVAHEAAHEVDRDCRASRETRATVSIRGGDRRRQPLLQEPGDLLPPLAVLLGPAVEALLEILPAGHGGAAGAACG